jgi:hypothetical protein
MTTTGGNVVRKRKVFRLSLSLLAIYLLSYLVLSLSGKYAPGAIGGYGIKWYSWFPLGFANTGKFGYGMWVFYCPLVTLDRGYWHTNDKGRSGSYPRTDVYPW